MSGDKDRLVALFEDEHFAKLSDSQKLFWSEFAAWLYSEKFIQGCVQKFLPYCANRLGEVAKQSGIINTRSDALIVSDHTNYAIGPHTDAAHRLITFLFYMPEDDRYSELGTSLYQCKDPDFICAGGPHYGFDKFNKVSTVEFLPNRLLMFVRSGRSFHGVEKIVQKNVERRLIINNVRLLPNMG